MSIHEFDNMSVLLRCNLLWKQGTVLKEGFREGNLIVLSSLFNFFVEEHYSMDSFKLTFLYSFRQLKDASTVTDA